MRSITIAVFVALAIPAAAQLRRAPGPGPLPRPTPFVVEDLNGRDPFCAPEGCHVDQVVCDQAELLESGRRLVGPRNPPLAWPPSPQEPCFNEVCKADQKAAEGEAAIAYAARLKRFEEALYRCEAH